VKLRPRIGDEIVRPAHIVVPRTVVAAVWLVRRLTALLLWVGRHPLLLLALGACVGALWLRHRYGLAPVGWAAAVVASILTGWALTAPDLFGRFVRYPLRAQRRAATVYRRRWQPACVTADLTVRRRTAEYLPELRAVTSTDQVDRLRVRMLPGQTVLDWSEAGEQLAQTFGVLDVRAHTGRRHEVELLCLVRDPLDRTVDLIPGDKTGHVDLSALVVGVREDGQPLTLPVLGSHLLVAGVTGAGKGSVIWATIAALGPAIRDRSVLVWAIDPKGGAELMPGAALFDRFVYGGQTANGAPWQTQIADLLDEAVTAMQTRLANMRARGIRKHVPTVDEPLLLLVVDEVASITAYVNEPALRRRIENAVSLILSQGRAPAVSLLLATQDPRKEVLVMRDLVPLRVALRTAEPVADLILGPEARARGARTEQIDPALPGVGYVLDEGQAEPLRVRFAYADDQAIERLAELFAPVPVIAPTLYGVS
jgi:DNA segregation ATPase FtsK/SpoIIIE, S-DNA-T family